MVLKKKVSHAVAKEVNSGKKKVAKKTAKK